ncbi:flavin reductase family protein [Desulforhopalus singaporensis]|uniref:NADH-FMN oxidoreductase RutF, flavin reductase (DIM6/NTAB) family n=1 Tax=Desulforhopalus singaporensis TaxID=91360 RepID=A0A1H0QAY0_9BACT|nr:flavin reductase family protein [Desulforhopalus singaporensis]SDP14350.1 NADH-FMN oxidoreductase RutF, flavin reductase (DIM6/NTAB) family [Desulforhopalus singaporensis]
MSKRLFKGAVLFGPIPAVLVTTIDKEGRPNVFTVGWTGVACTHPPMVTVAVRKERLSYDNIRETGEFVINLTTREMLKITDFCGCRSGRKVDKLKHFGLEIEPGTDVAVPSLKKSPVALECKVKSVTELGSHDLFLAEIVRNKVEPSIIDANGKIDMAKAGLLAYCHGEYFGLGKRPLASFGHSVARRSTRKKGHGKKVQATRSYRGKKRK